MGKARLKKVIWGGSAVLALLAGCSQTRPYDLKRAETELAQAKGDPFVVENAPLVLNQAEKTYVTAEQTWEKSKDEEQVIPLARLAQQQVQDARDLAGKNAVTEQRAMMQAQAALKTNRILLRELRKLSNDQLQERNVVSINADLLFEVDKAQLTSGGRQELQPLVDFLNNNQSYRVIIEGHTDSTGNSEYNKELSEERAQAVKEYLVSEGVRPGRMTAIGRGEQYPIASNSTPAGRLQNRRVEIVITPQS